MPILDTKKPVGILHDGDSYQYLSNDKLEFESPVYDNPQWAPISPSFGDPLAYAVLPSGLITLRGQAEATAIPVTPSFVFNLPHGARPKQDIFVVGTYNRSGSNGPVPAVFVISTDGYVIFPNNEGFTLSANDKIALDGVSFIPTA